LVESDENFAFIAGYTSGGAAYGLTHQEMKNFDKKIESSELTRLNTDVLNDKNKVGDNELNRKEFTAMFQPFKELGKQIWVITRVKKLPSEIVKMAINLASLDFIKYVRICDDTLSASSENYPNRPKVTITHMNHETATGIQILYSTEHEYVDFFDINSPIKGNGSKIANAILKNFPKEWTPAVTMDWSDWFWQKIEEKYDYLNWI
jgi:hypothetical protein